MNFGFIVGAIGKAAATGYSIIKTALPILKALRSAIPEVDQAFDKIEEGIAAGGVAADDFLDANIDTIEAIEKWSGRGEAVMHEMGELAAALRVASQEQTPDTITEEEALMLANKLIALRALIATWNDETAVTLAKAEAIDT